MKTLLALVILTLLAAAVRAGLPRGQRFIKISGKVCGIKAPVKYGDCLPGGGEIILRLNDNGTVSWSAP